MEALTPILMTIGLLLFGALLVALYGPYKLERAQKLSAPPKKRAATEAEKQAADDEPGSQSST